MAARLNESNIFTPYQARQFLDNFRQGNGEVKAEQKTLKGIILQQAKQIETIQHGLNSSICAFTGCTLLLSGYLPERLNPMVKPLLDSAKVCSDHFTREILASAFCSLLELAKERNPSLQACVRPRTTFNPSVPIVS